MSEDLYNLHKDFNKSDPFRKTICDSEVCDIFFYGKYESSIGSTVKGKRTRNIPKDELLKIDAEIKRFKDALKNKREEKLDNK